MKVLLLTTIAALLLQAPPPKASISGIVLRAGTGEPVESAQVLLKGNSNNAPRAVTGSDGRFVMNDIDPGQYTLQFGLTGYVTQFYGQRVLDNTAKPVVVRAGQAATDVVMTLIPTGAVSGRVRNTELQPLVGVPVRIFHYVYKATGRRELQSGGVTTTDDRGEFRLFGITPGQHYLEAGGMALYFNRTEDINVNTVAKEQPVTFYPASADASQAKPLDIAPGAELRGIDFVLGPLRLFGIRGHVVGEGISSVYVRGGSQLETLAPRAANSKVDSSGNFQVDDLPPGEYTVTAQVHGRAGSVAVRIRDADIGGIELAIGKETHLSGRFVLDGGPWRSPEKFYANVGLLESTSGADVGTVVEPDGTFTISELPSGSYRPFVRVPPGMYLRAATYGNVDVIENPLLFDGISSTTLELQVSSKTATLRGTVRDARSGPSARVAVLLLPDRRDRRELYFKALTKENGEFEMTNLPPGNYRIFSWESIESYSWHDPVVMARFEDKGKAIRLEESAKETVDLRVIPAEIQP